MSPTGGRSLDYGIIFARISLLIHLNIIFMRRLHYAFALVTLLSSIWLSCRKDITLDDSDKNFPLNVTAAAVNDSVVLSWENKRITQFQRVVVLRSSEPMPANISPLNPLNAQVLFNSSDATVNRFAEARPFFFTTAYYKVFLQIDGRFIQSDNVRLQFSNFAEDGRPESVYVHPDSNWIAVTLMSNIFAPQLVLLDLNQNKVLGRVTINDFSDPQYSSATFMRYQNKEFLQVITNSQRYLRFSLPQMTLVEEKTIPYQSWSVLAQRNDDLIFMTHYDYYNAVTVRKTGNILNAIQEFERPNNYYYVRKQYFLNAAERKILEVSPYDVHRFSVTSTGALNQAFSKSAALTGYTPYTSQMPIAPTGKYFIPNISGAIYNDELGQEKMVPLDPQRNIVDYCFSADGNSVYAVDQGFFPNFSARIRKFNLNDMQLTDVLEFNGIQARRLVLGANQQLVFFFTNGQEPARFSFKTLQF
jgi:sulfur carrier protein ThiS